MTLPVRYLEHPPHPALSPFVETYWTARGRPRAGTGQVVLPDGCMDILVSLGAAPPGPPGGSGWPTRHVVGTWTRPLEVRYGGDVHLVAVRFRPGGAPAFLEVAADELTDGRAELDALWGPGARRLEERIAEAAAGEAAPLPVPDGEEPAPSPARPATVDALEAALLRLLPAALERRDPGVLEACRLLREAGRRRPPVAALAEAVGVGRRQLERRFRAAVGLSPAVTGRVLRFRRAVDLLAGRSDLGLSAVAWHAGFADQAHLTREMRALAGTTPGAYREARPAPPPDGPAGG